jgi:hypothetical protein
MAKLSKMVRSIILIFRFKLLPSHYFALKAYPEMHSFNTELGTELIYM